MLWVSFGVSTWNKGPFLVWHIILLGNCRFLIMAYWWWRKTKLHWKSISNCTWAHISASHWCIIQIGINVTKRTFWRAPNEDSDQPARPRSLIRVFVGRMKKLCTLGYPKCAQRRFWSDCANAQADLNLRWAHMSDGTFSDVVARIIQ